MERGGVLKKKDHQSDSQCCISLQQGFQVVIKKGRLFKFDDILCNTACCLIGAAAVTVIRKHIQTPANKTGRQEK